MVEQLLHCANIVATFQQMRGKGRARVGVDTVLIQNSAPILTFPLQAG